MIYVRCQHTSEHMMAPESATTQAANANRPRVQFHLPMVDARVCVSCLALLAVAPK